jgi:enoyl-CoA hydratase/carnithine racemase
MAVAGLVLTGEEAVATGLADRLLGPSGAGAPEDLAGQIVRGRSTLATRRTKAFLGRGRDRSLDAALEEAQEEFLASRASEDARAGLEGFRKKEAVRWDLR